MPKHEEDPTIERKTWYKEDRYYEYHQTKGHATNGCRGLRNKIQRLIEDGFYVCPTKVEDIGEEQHVNVIFHGDVCATFTRGRAEVVIDLITCEKELPKDPRSFDLIEQLKSTQAKVSLFELLQILAPHREMMNQIFKNSQIDRNISIITFAKKVKMWSKGDVITFHPSEKFSRGVTRLHPPLFIKVGTFGNMIKRSLINGGAYLNITITHLLS